MRICVVGNMLGRNQGFVTTQGQILADLLSNDGYQVVSTSSQLNRFLRLAEIVMTIIRSRKQVEVLVLEVYSGLYFILADVASMLAKLMNIPMIFVLHGGNLPAFSVRFTSWVKRVLRRADIVIAPSPFLAKGLSSFGIDIRVVPNIVEIENYPFRHRKSTRPSFLWMRAFHEIYNPRMALDVFREVRERHPDASLTMAGVNKGLEPEMKRLADEFGLSGCVSFPGFLGPKAKVAEFSKADIFLNTNHIDNMPVSVIEACAIGLPVVATNVGGIADLLSDGENAILVPDAGVSAMVDSIERLLNDDVLAEKLSRNGRQLAERSSWNALRDQWTALFEEVVAGKGERSQVEAPLSQVIR